MYKDKNTFTVIAQHGSGIWAGIKVKYKADPYGNALTIASGVPVL
jgi:hypothetical protein